MHWATTYPKISFLGQKLWPPAFKRFIFETQFEGPFLPCETEQVPYLCHFSFDIHHIFFPGLTLDIDRGNLLRLGHDGTILTAMHGTKRLTDFEIEKVYGRCRKKHPGSDYTQHLNEFGPMKNVDFRLHNFMDYFDIAAPLVW